MPVSEPASPITPNGDAPKNRRILLVDDNAAIHQDFRKILCDSPKPSEHEIADLEAALFGPSDTPRRATAEVFLVDSAMQGREALTLVERAVAEGRPYAMAFVDVRMPPGWDGIETTQRLWKVDPSLQVVICTAYSDYSWDQMIASLGQSDGLVILKKPFDPAEVLQLAHALTEKWRLSRAARLKLDELESMVQARTAELRAEIVVRERTESELQRAKEVAEQASRAKSAFLANMSHEIRTPMNGVLGMCQLLLDSGLSPEQRDLAETLIASGETLLGLLNDVLDFSKIEAEKMVLEHTPFSLEDVIDGVVQLLAQRADEKQLELVAYVDPEIPAPLIGDPVRLRQVLLNLLSNAIKFTAQGEVAIQAQLRAANPDNVRVEISVRDTGIGMAEKDLARLFHPFTQADTSITRRFGGTGLGLAICHRLVGMMGSDIAVQSQPDHGSTFSFMLELPRVAESAPPHLAAPNLRQVRALVADANATNRKLLHGLLNKWEMEHAEVPDAPEAVRRLQAAIEAGRPFDLALFDFHLPGTEPIAFARDVHRLFGAQAPRLVLMCSPSQRPGRPSLDAAGIAASLLKPLRKQILRDCLVDVLGRPRAVESGMRPSGVEEKPPLPGPIRVLVAEDNPINQKVASLQLRRLGFEADIVGNGREAIAAIAQERYDIVFMDCQMPEVDGFEATRSIREREAAESRPRLPIVAMTAGAVKGDRDHCLAAGMDDYVPKPVRWEEIPAVILRHLPALYPAVP